jgi:predicted nuclease of predicted toxin-antitoxin system
MLRLATDADVNNAIIRGLRRQAPDLDLMRSQDALPEGTSDPDVLAWAAAGNRVLITNDRGTMVAFEKLRLAAGDPSPGIIVTTKKQSIGAAIDDILLIARCMTEEEVRDRAVVFLPL